MGLRSFFACSPAPALFGARARDYQKRVAADGGALFSLAAVQEAYAQAANWGLDPAVTHWTSPQFGNKLAPDGTVIKRYCLFGFDAEPVGAGAGWTPVDAPGLPPQHQVGQGFVVPAMAWPTRALTVVAGSTHTSATSTSGYNFFPIAELGPDFNNYPGWIIGVETASAGGNAGGVSNPMHYKSVDMAPLGFPSSHALTVDPTRVGDDQVAFHYNAYRSLRTVQAQAYSTAPFLAAPVYLGVRGAQHGYYWAGTINDVFFTNKVLPDAARAWLENQRWRYVATLPRPGDAVASTDARWQELAGYWGTIDYADQPLVRYAEPGNAGRADIGFYGKRVVVEHSNFQPVRGYFYVDGVENAAFAVSSPGQTTEIICDALGYHTLSLHQDPSEGYTARGILHIHAS